MSAYFRCLGCDVKWLDETATIEFEEDEKPALCADCRQAIKVRSEHWLRIKQLEARNAKLEALIALYRRREKTYDPGVVCNHSQYADITELIEEALAALDADDVVK